MSRRASDLERFADRYVGIPAIALLGFLPKHRMPDAASVSRIGILKTNAIGDTLLLAGSFEALRAAYLGVTITLVTSTENAGVAPLFGRAIDEHIIVNLRSPASAIRSLRASHFDLLIECGPWPRVDAILAALSGARYRVGFRVRGQARHFAFDAVVEHSDQVHQIENIHQLVRKAGGSRFAVPTIARPNVLNAEGLPRRPYIVFHPWSGGYMGWVKEWPRERWLELGARVHAAFGWRIVITGGRGDTQRAAQLAAGLNARGCDTIDTAGRYTLAELADVLCNSEAAVCVNTGVMHLAALLGVATLSLEGPVPIRRWGPIGPRTRSVVSTSSGCGYLDLGFEYAGHCLTCMDGVSVDAAMSAIDDLLRPAGRDG